ncbi:pentatricopeptide repeat-containing protein At3g49740 [Sesamum indicum]|uniref:Pentatricopeptide repeat-containing protein At3g49740 n=1 Tax=Sesamum indicum TaxID=4182 RepID=A0A6I9STJ4_SESIN|nr:pentatricopeptide repeat-containing protein At3g49740 [Sesamum indicum]XP_011073673.1 pentatricopeptide repeat-containing protein At3g49740 [Sesamum indicum]XP_020548531.1 pentatricopeptide repeat-containing protein At3g49740 [Sesamum indicum]
MVSKCYKPLIAAAPGNPSQELIKLNCLLKNLIHGGQFSDALQLFRRIHLSHHLKPDHYTVSTALTACANLQETRVGAQLHSHSIQSGLEIFPHVTNTLLSLYAKSGDLVSVKRVYDEIKKPDVYSHTTLLSACAKLGEVDYACHMFDQMPHENVAVWNAMITGCAENGHDEIAFGFFLKMHVLGVKADNYTFASVLSLTSLRQFDFGRQVHSLVVKTGFLRRTSVVNSLVTMYFNCESVTDAYGVFEEVGCEVGDEITYNAIIAGLVNLEKDEDALTLFIDMQTVGLRPTELTFVSVMGACLFSKIASQVHGQAIKMGFEEYTSVSNAAISMYSNCGELDAARLVFRMLKEKDIVSWNAIIASYAQENLGKDASLAYLQMQRQGLKPDEFTFGSLLASSELLEVAEMIQAIVIKNSLILKVEVLNGLLSAFSRNGEIEQASKLFCGMQSRNLISWNAMISGFLLNGMPANGLQQFFKMLLSGLRPNHYTLSLVLSICASTSDLQHGKQVHAYILKFGYFFHTLLGNALVALYSKCGSLNWSLRVFQNIMRKDAVSWNSIISAYAQHGEGKEAVRWFEAMQYSSAVKPDKATFTAVLSACSHSGLVADGLRIFTLMVNGYGIEPKIHHFSCIVDLLGRAGFLDAAERLIKGRGINVDPSVWWTLFSSCVAHDNLQLGSIVAEFLLETGKDDPAVYVLLSNLYANAGKWEESANLRELMKKYNVMKQPGSSWITS